MQYVAPWRINGDKTLFRPWKALEKLHQSPTRVLDALLTFNNSIALKKDGKQLDFENYFTVIKQPIFFKYDLHIIRISK